LTAKEKCPRFNSCEATLCPLDPNDHSWYPDEAVCQRCDSDTFSVPRWVAMQKLVAEKLNCSREQGYFVIEMLEQLTEVAADINGLNPDGFFSTEAKDIQIWLQEHQGVQGDLAK